MDIIDLDQRRREAQPPAPDYATCPCGEAWFELRDGPEATPNGAVCMTLDGSVTGYTGRPHCISCSKPYTRPPSRQ
jgi:hypothetical protein